MCSGGWKCQTRETKTKFLKRATAVFQLCLSRVLSPSLKIQIDLRHERVSQSQRPVSPNLKMSTKACSKHVDSARSSKKCAKKSAAVKKRKHSKWKHKRKSKSRLNYLQREAQRHQQVIRRPSWTMASSSQDQHAASSFWKNYRAAMDWQGKHFVNYWKSRCSALELENQHLYNTIQMLTGAAKVENGSDEAEEAEAFDDAQPEETDEGEECKEEDDILEEDEDCEEAGEEVFEDCHEEEFTFVIDEKMIDFLETSAKHKMELKKKRDAEQEQEASEELVKATEKMKLPRVIMQERRTEMEKLYGAESAPMILGMETAMQLSFDRFVGKHQPKHWPNIPLNL